ncbi:hypothetical protein AB0758_00035 [Tolypothrix bouteillei VB521301_2]|uniref:hypothetical protein n=1 Tax=Tolypothrix bouteillei TaxID=1246981 RepID=UPI0038B50B61
MNIKRRPFRLQHFDFIRDGRWQLAAELLWMLLCGVFWRLKIAYLLFDDVALSQTRIMNAAVAA